MHLKQDLKILAIMLLLIAFLMFFPLLVAFIYGENQAVYGFGTSIILIVVCSIFLLFVLRKNHLVNIMQRDGYFLVSMIWIVGAAFGAIH
ncbi:MAG: hypothetical protein HUK24_04825, partial [Sphaerochaetaceae bacterium]|nr:hypothetical protein [Sphaerochaetaceae bacterium]